jgi:hypothetical protein
MTHEQQMIATFDAYQLLNAPVDVLPAQIRTYTIQEIARAYPPRQQQNVEYALCVLNHLWTRAAYDYRRSQGELSVDLMYRESQPGEPGHDPTLHANQPIRLLPVLFNLADLLLLHAVDREGANTVAGLALTRGRPWQRDKTGKEITAVIQWFSRPYEIPNNPLAALDRVSTLAYLHWLNEAFPPLIPIPAEAFPFILRVARAESLRSENHSTRIGITHSR